MQDQSNPERALDDLSQARMAALRDQVTQFVGENVHAMFHKVRERFFIAARDADDAENEARFMSTVEEAERIESTVQAAFERALLEHLDALGEREVRLAVPEEKADGERPAHVMSLVDSVKLDDWVMLDNIIKRHRARLQETEHAVREKLGKLAGVSLDDRTDPLTVEALCALFHRTVESAAPSRSLRLALFEGFERAMIRRLDILYIGLLGTMSAPLGPLSASLNDDDTGGSLAHHLDTGPVALDLMNDTDAGGPIREATTRGSGIDAPAGKTADRAPRAEPLDATRLNGVLNAIVRNAQEAGLANPEDIESLKRWLKDYGTVSESGIHQESIRALTELATNVLSASTLSDRSRARLWHLLPPLLHLMVSDDGYLERELGAARYDPVTGLLDRSAFLVRLQRALKIGARRNRCVVVCRIKVKQLARIEIDLGGVVAGRLLRLLGTMVTRQLSGRACAARFDGDELAVLLERSSPEQGRQFAERLHDAVAQTNWHHDDQRIEFSLDVGVADSVNTWDDADALLDSARPGAP